MLPLHFTSSASRTPDPSVSFSNVPPPRLRFSEEFADPFKLLAVSEQHGLEGTVSKRRDQPYRSGKNPGWIKVKTVAWREANRRRGELFERRY